MDWFDKPQTPISEQKTERDERKMKSSRKRKDIGQDAPFITSWKGGRGSAGSFAIGFEGLLGELAGREKGREIGGV